MNKLDLSQQLDIWKEEAKRQLIEAIRSQGSDEYVFFSTWEEHDNGKDGPMVMVEEPTNEAPILHLDYYLWKISRITVVNDEIIFYGFKMEDWETDDEEECVGHIEPDQYIEAILMILEENSNNQHKTQMKLYHTNYQVAVNWLNNNFVMCNNIHEVDPSVWDNFLPLSDLEYEPEYDEDGEVVIPRCSECGAELHQNGPNMECPECGECEDRREIFQWYISDCSETDAKYLSENFGLTFTYSDLLDCYILCVTHFGTSWDYVDWTTKNPIAERGLGQKK